MGGLSGCNSDSLTSAAGHYEGFSVSGSSATDPTQSSISGEIQSLSDQELKLQIRTAPSAKEIDFDVQITSDGLEVSSPSGLLQAPLALQPSGDHCFASGPANPANEVCFDGQELTIVLSGTKFVLDRMDPTKDPSPAPSMEIPRIYSEDELVARAQSRSFTSEVEYESVVQAKLTAQNAYLNLLPHIGFGSGMDLIGFVTTTMIHAIGDFVPFFLPNRWFQAAALNDAAHAEFDSYRVVQANAMNVVQGLALSVLRDEQALLTMEQNRVAITEVRDEVLSAEQNGGTGVQVGTSDDVTSVLNTLVSSIDAMKENIQEEKVALSQAAGFNNPSAVAGVLPVSLPTIAGPIAGNPPDFDQAAINRAIALLQLDDLVLSAKNTKASSYFQWLDPSGSDQGSLGFGLISYVEINSSMIQQLYDKKAQTQSALLQMVHDTLSSSQLVSDQCQLANQASETDQSRIDRLLLDFRSGIQFEMASLVGALGDKTTSDINHVNAQYAYLTLQARMDFLTYSGPYATLLGEKEN
jgi:hypothetical protein